MIDSRDAGIYALRRRNPLPPAASRHRPAPRRCAGPTRPGDRHGPDLARLQPLYLQIKALILRSLQAGEWRPGEAIPSEIELAARFGVCQGTVRKAIDELAADNLVVRRQGKGTFVATHAEAARRSSGSCGSCPTTASSEGPASAASSTAGAWRAPRWRARWT